MNLAIARERRQKQPANKHSNKNGGACPNLFEQEPLTSKVVLTVSWKKEQIDLVELARLRWVENWTYERLAVHFGIGRVTVHDWVRRIRVNSALAGLTAASGIAIKELGK